MYIEQFVSLNSKQPFSWTEDCEQFCFRTRDCCPEFSRAVFTDFDQIAQRSSLLKCT